MSLVNAQYGGDQYNFGHLDYYGSKNAGASPDQIWNYLNSNSDRLKGDNRAGYQGGVYELARADYSSWQQAQQRAQQQMQQQQQEQMQMQMPEPKSSGYGGAYGGRKHDFRRGTKPSSGARATASEWNDPQAFQKYMSSVGDRRQSYEYKKYDFSNSGSNQSEASGGY